MKNISLKNSLTCLFIILFMAKSFAIVKPNSLFSNNMVLQQGVIVPVWGTANEDEKVTVEFNGQKVSTIAKNGKWMVKLKALKANSTPSEMIISGENTIKIVNILVGEVWICSGQSNMARQLGLRTGQKPIINWKEEASAANYPAIRQYYVPNHASDSSISDANSKWLVCDTNTVKSFTAVGYFFGRDLHKQLNVPIGLLFSAVGGTPAENWTSRAAMESNPELKVLVEDYDKAINNFPNALAKYKENEATILAKWTNDSLNALAAHKPLPIKPIPPRKPSGGAGGLYNGMINPLIPFAIKGVIWYQGEANNGKTKQYQTLFPTLISDWRKNWNEGEFPFLYVQIAPFKGISPELREAQLLSLNKVQNIAMAVITDCGDSADIHPAFKQPVGNRLSLAARALAYKEKIEYSGPLYKGYEVKNNAIEIVFTHIGKGLISKDGDLIGFTIAGDDKKFVPAKAVIKGNKVIVSSSEVTSPKSVRFGWANVPITNLFNQDGLPASPFRTDVE